MALVAKSTKQLFLVVATSKAADIDERLTNLGIPIFKVADNAWFATYSGTATEAAEEFGVRTENLVGTGVVASVSNVAGRANPDLWEWLKLNRPTDG